MKKKTMRRSGTSVQARRATPKKSGNLLVLIKSWMFVVMVALMLGIGTIVGTYISQQMNAATPAVAGVSIEAE